MSDTGCNYRKLLDCNSELIVNQLIPKWKREQKALHNTIITFYELIDIRAAVLECIEYFLHS